MNTVKFIIPVKKYLFKLLEIDILKLPEAKQLQSTILMYDTFKMALFDFCGYQIDHNELQILFLQKRLFKKTRTNTKFAEYLHKYPSTSYQYLTFKLPYIKSGSKNLRFDKIHFYIEFFNSQIEIQFWYKAVSDILYNRKEKLNDAMNTFYDELKLSESDYKQSSFKTMLYYVKKTDPMYQFWDKMIEKRNKLKTKRRYKY